MIIHYPLTRKENWKSLEINRLRINRCSIKTQFEPKPTQQEESSPIEFRLSLDNRPINLSIKPVGIAKQDHY